MARTAQFIKNKQGRAIRVVLSVRAYEKMLDELDELDAIRAFDAAKASTEPPIPYRTYREKRLKAGK